MGGWVGLRVGLEAAGNRKISFLNQEYSHDCLARAFPQSLKITFLILREI
jgi:hypothetical protein